MSPAGEIQDERRGAVSIITISNPGKHNALTVDMWRSLYERVSSHGADGETRCIVIRGAGTTAFASGADIGEFVTHRSTRAQVADYNEKYVLPAIRIILECPVPTIAMVSGSCLGGGLEIAAACDYRVASTSAKIGAPTQKMGFPLGFGETELVFKMFGRSVAMDLLLASRVFSASEALQAGIVHRVEAPNDLEGCCIQLAERFAGFSPFAIREIKSQLLRLLSDWTSVTETERLKSYAFADTQEYQEGFKAFLNKKIG